MGVLRNVRSLFQRQKCRIKSIVSSSPGKRQFTKYRAHLKRYYKVRAPQGNVNVKTERLLDRDEDEKLENESSTVTCSVISDEKSTKKFSDKNNVVINETRLLRVCSMKVWAKTRKNVQWTNHFFEACKRGYVKEVQLLLKKATKKDYSINFGRAMKLVAENRSTKVCKFLLDEIIRRDPDNVIYQFPEALTIAAKHGYHEIVRELIKVTDATYCSSKALCQAAEQGHVKCVELLMPHSNVNVNESEALRVAAYGGHVEVVDCLLRVSKKNARIALTLYVMPVWSG